MRSVKSDFGISQSSQSSPVPRQLYQAESPQPTFSTQATSYLFQYCPSRKLLNQGSSLDCVLILFPPFHQALTMGKRKAEDEEWELFKDDILDLYAGHTLYEVMDIMNGKGFRRT